MTHASVFSGIGGPEVAATMLGWSNLFHCEINPFGRAVLDYWYPNAKSYDDITKTDFSEWRGRVDVLTGGFPCQPFSYAGQRRGAEDDRYLWPYMFKCIDAIRPTWVVAENVGGILTMVEQGEVSEVGVQGSLFGEEDAVRRYELRETFTLERICDDLETHGYAVQPVLVPACAVGAPHRRDRVFIVGRRRDDADVAHADSTRAGDNQRATCDEGRTTGEDWRAGIRPRDGQTGASGIEPTSADAENAVCDGLQRGHSEEQGYQRDERNAGAGDSERLCDEGSRLGDTDAPADTPCGGEGAPGEGGSVEGNGSNQDKQPCQRRAVSEWNSRFYELLRNAADTADPRLQGRHDCHSEGHGQSEDGCAGQPCQVRNRESVGRPGARWADFPSQSPVHRGNDGLPFPLDDLTLSPAKWRTEALKAYGNAIVPQVMYEIFRAIEIAENTPPR